MKPRHSQQDDRTVVPDTSGRITSIEVVAYTAVIVLIGAVAAGWFDAMVPWK
jgi:hypothetical protein